jgi:hypothetical protein
MVKTQKQPQYSVAELERAADEAVQDTLILNPGLPVANIAVLAAERVERSLLLELSRATLLKDLTTRALRSMKDLTKVPDEDLYAEIGRRRAAARTTFGGGRAPSCVCGKCLKCRNREAMRKYRAAKKES